MTLIKELLSEAHNIQIDQLAKAIAGATVNNGTRVFDIDVEEDTIHFAIEFDFPEGYIKGSDVKAKSDLIKSASAQKSQDWRNGEYGADYTITLKTPLSDEDAKKLVTALKKAVK